MNNVITLAAAKRHLALAGWVIKFVAATGKYRVYPQNHGACDYHKDSIMAAVAEAERQIVRFQSLVFLPEGSY